MGTVIAGAVGLLLALYAAADIVIRLCYRILFMRRGRDEPLCLFVREHDAEYQIRRLNLWRHLSPNGGYDWTVILPDAKPELCALCAELQLTAYTRKQWERICKSPLQSERDTL